MVAVDVLFVKCPHCLKSASHSTRLSPLNSHHHWKASCLIASLCVCMSVWVCVCGVCGCVCVSVHLCVCVCAGTRTHIYWHIKNLSKRAICHQVYQNIIYKKQKLFNFPLITFLSYTKNMTAHIHIDHTPLWVPSVPITPKVFHTYVQPVLPSSCNYFTSL